MGSDWLKERLSAFRMYKIYRVECPVKAGKRNGVCREAYEDTYGSYRPGCTYCNGKGWYRDSEDFTAGHLMSNVYAALMLERAWWEGYSAGLGDARSPRA